MENICWMYVLDSLHALWTVNIVTCRPGHTWTKETQHKKESERKCFQTMWRGRPLCTLRKITWPADLMCVHPAWIIVTCMQATRTLSAKPLFLAIRNRRSNFRIQPVSILQIGNNWTMCEIISFLTHHDKPREVQLMLELLKCNISSLLAWSISSKTVARRPMGTVQKKTWRADPTRLPCLDTRCSHDKKTVAHSELLALSHTSEIRFSDIHLP
jgi:hypothetical protein